MNYKQAVEAALQGNADAFSALYESTQNNMYYLALKYMKIRMMRKMFFRMPI